MSSTANGSASGSASSAVAGLSPAEQLKARHAAADSHPVTVEDVEDEDDVAHPPPSTQHHTTGADGTTLSDIAQGKKKATGNGTPRQPLNVDSEEAFPSLGAPKTGPATHAQTWGKPPASASNGFSSTISANQAKSGRPSVGAPSSAQGGNAQAGQVNLPGRHTERIIFTRDQIIPRQQLKKSIPEVLNDINKRSKARVNFRETPQGYVFEGVGPTDAVRQALKDVASQVGSKQSVRITVPSSVKAAIIGRQGQTIQALSKRTGARINIPRGDDAPTPGQDDDEATVDITIEGDAVAAELARREIDSIVKERSSGATMRIKDIPAEFYPFLAGPRDANIPRLTGGHDVNIQIPHYYAWDAEPPPNAANGGPPSFVHQPNLPIRISGDRDAARAARERLDHQVQALRRALTTHELSIERARHQFIVGKRGDAVHDVLHRTGCSVVVPPAHDESEVLYVVGPPEKIEKAVDYVLDLASSMAVQNVDPSRAHPKAPSTHASDLTRYLQQRQALAAIEQQYNASISLPTPQQNGPWQIYSRDGKAGMRARTDVVNLINAHPPSRFHSLDVHPFYHQHLRAQAAPQIRRAHGVHLLFPDDEESDKLILIFEEPGSPSEYAFPQRAPSQAEVAQFEKALQEAVNHIRGIAGSNDIASQQMEAPSKFHDKIQRYIDREQRGLPEDRLPVQLLLPRGRAAQSGNFNLRGSSGDVEAMHEKILAFIEQEKKDEVERGFTLNFDYPHKFANVLIGRRGDNIKKISEDYDVEVNYSEGKVEVKGPKAKAEAAKSHITSLGRKLEDEATHSIKIPQQYHASLKGSKGNQVIRLQERYNVHINFPRQVSNDDDAASEVSKNQSQAPDVVTIRGPRKGADEAREELLNLLQYVKDTSHIDTISVSTKQIPSIIGPGGRELDALRLATGAQIDIPKRESHGDSERVEIKLKGTKKQVDDAKKLLKERVSVFDDTVVEKLEVDPKYYKTIIGPSGQTLREIVTSAGGPDDSRAANRIIQLPKPGASEHTIKIEGQKDIVEKIVKAIKSKVDDIGSHVTESINVVPEQQRLIIGAGGSKRREIEEEFSIQLNIPKQETKGPERAIVKLTGKPENVQKAKAHIEGILKEQASETIHIPKAYHHHVADDGNLFRRLRNDHRVTVDHSGQQIPEKPATAGASRTRNANGASMPLITDDSSSNAGAHSWELVESATNGSAADENDTIPWVLRGSTENITKARSIIERALQNASKPSATGYLILPDPKLYRLVIGQGGATINGIRGKTGVHIIVPRQGSSDEAIEIKGTKEGVEKAKELVLEAIEKGPQRKR